MARAVTVSDGVRVASRVGDGSAGSWVGVGVQNGEITKATRIGAGASIHAGWQPANPNSKPATKTHIRFVKRRFVNRLPMDIHECANLRPVVKPFCIFEIHINTTMTHARSEIMVPIGAVNRVITIVKHGMWHIG